MIPSTGVDFDGSIKFHLPMPLGFEWDDDKASSNLAKHGVSFPEAATVFADPLSLTIPDPAHSQVEDRGDNIRVISTRRASKRERKAYEEAS